MIDVEVRRQRVICEAAGVRDICDVSDGFHTFRQLYYQRMILFATIVKQNRDKAWKSLRHEDGELCFGGGWFIVGIDTPEGSYTYHYENKYFDLFDCEILDYGKQWDGHTEKDVTRLLSLKYEPCDYYDTYNKTCRWSEVPKEPCEDAISRQAVLEIQSKYAEDIGATKFCQMRDDIKALPSVTPQPKIGHWISHSEHCKMNNLRPSGLGCYWWCSECDYGVECEYFYTVNFKHCPNCGAEMESEEV